MAAHLYWSLNFTATNGDTFYTIFDVDMRATVAGADQCSGGTPSATSGVAADGFDNNSSTAWVSNTTTERLTYQFASPVDVGEYALIGNGNNASRAPKDWTLEWSDDGISWTVADTIVGETGWAIGEKRSYVPVPPPANGHLYWRVNVSNSNDGANLRITEIEMFGSIGGTDQCNGGTPSASSELGAEVAARAFDEFTSMHWRGLTNQEWIQYQFASAVIVPQYRINAAGTMGPKDWTFEYSDNGVDWFVFHAVTGETGWSGFAGGEWRTYTPPLDVTELDNVGGLVVSSVADTVLHTPDLFAESDAVGAMKLSSQAETVFWEEVIDVRSGLKFSATEDSASFITSHSDTAGGLKLSSTAEGTAWVAYTLGGSFKLIGLAVTGNFLRNMEGSLKPLGFRVTGTISSGQAAVGRVKPIGFQAAGTFVQFGGVAKVVGFRISGGVATGNVASGFLKPAGLLVAGDIQTQGMLQGSFNPFGLRILGSIDSGQASTGTASLIRFSVVGSLSTGNAIAGSVGLVLLRVDGSTMSSGSMAGQFMVISLAAYGSYSRVQR